MILIFFRCTPVHITYVTIVTMILRPNCTSNLLTDAIRNLTDFQKTITEEVLTKILFVHHRNMRPLVIFFFFFKKSLRFEKSKQIKIKVTQILQMGNHQLFTQAPLSCVLHCMAHPTHPSLSTNYSKAVHSNIYSCQCNTSNDILELLVQMTPKTYVFLGIFHFPNTSNYFAKNQIFSDHINFFY